MLWEQSVAMNREKGRPYLGEAALFLRKMESEEIREVQEEVKMAVGKKKKLSGILRRGNPTKNC